MARRFFLVSPDEEDRAVPVTVLEHAAGVLDGHAAPATASERLRVMSSAVPPLIHERLASRSGSPPPSCVRSEVASNPLSRRRRAFPAMRLATLPRPPSRERGPRGRPRKYDPVTAHSTANRPTSNRPADRLTRLPSTIRTRGAQACSPSHSGQLNDSSLHGTVAGRTNSPKASIVTFLVLHATGLTPAMGDILAGRVRTTLARRSIASTDNNEAASGVNAHLSGLSAPPPCVLRDQPCRS